MRSKGLQTLVPFLAIVAVAAVTIGLTAVSRQTALLKSMEHWTSDWRTALLADQAPSQHPRTAVIVVDDETMRGYPYRSPVDRGLLAQLIEALDAAGASVIGLDFVFDQPTEPEKDRRLIAAIRKAAAKVVIGTLDARVPLRPDQREFQNRFAREAGAATGFVNLRYEIDNVVRGEAETDRSAGNPSGERDGFASAIARRAGTIDPTPNARIAWLKSPRDGSDVFLTLPAAQIAAPANDAERKLAQMLLASLKDRIVLIGGDLSDQADRHLTPLAKLGEGLTPGVVIHTQAVAQKLDGRRLTLLNPEWEVALVLIFSVCGMLAGLRFKASHWTTSTLPIVLLALCDAIFFAGLRTIVPFAAPAIAWICSVFIGRWLKWIS